MKQLLAVLSNVFSTFLLLSTSLFLCICYSADYGDNVSEPPTHLERSNYRITRYFQVLRGQVSIVQYLKIVTWFRFHLYTVDDYLLLKRDKALAYSQVYPMFQHPSSEVQTSSSPQPSSSRTCYRRLLSEDWRWNSGDA